MLGSIASKLARTASRPLVIVPPKAQPSRVRHAVIFATRRLGNSLVLQVQGEIDMATAVELERQAARLLAEAGGRLVLDLSETTFADAAGARVTERLSRCTSELGGRLVLVVTMPAVRRSLGVTPNPWLAVTDSLDAAVDAVTDRPEPPSLGHLTS
jgi:anti-anti-sigma factor